MLYIIGFLAFIIFAIKSSEKSTERGKQYVARKNSLEEGAFVTFLKPYKIPSKRGEEKKVVRKETIALVVDSWWKSEWNLETKEEKQKDIVSLYYLEYDKVILLKVYSFSNNLAIVPRKDISEVEFQ